MRFVSRSLGGLSTLPLIRSTPSSSFLSTFENAKGATLGPGKKTTVLRVSLVDVHIFELVEKGKSESWSLFAHTFALGIGPKVVVVWQS